MKVLNEPITVERGKEGVILLQLTVPFGCDYYKDKEKFLSCPLAVELKTQQLSKCVGITSNNLCGTKFTNENWNEVRNIVVHHNTKFDYKISTIHRVKLSTVQFPSHPIWSNVELPVIQVQYTFIYFWKGNPIVLLCVSLLLLCGSYILLTFESERLLHCFKINNTLPDHISSSR